MENKNNFKNSKLCISTIDPYSGGGGLSMLCFFYKKSVESNFEPFIVYNIIASLRKDKKDITIPKILIKRKPKIFKEYIFNMQGYGIQRVLPELEFFNYSLNLKLWEKVFDSTKPDIFFAIGGTNLCALPFVLANKDFYIWVASTLYEDRIDRIKNFPLLRKIREYLSLPELLHYEKLIFEKAKKIFVISKYTKNLIIKKYNVLESKIIVNSQPIDSNKFKPIEFSKRKRDYILFVGRLNDQRKNISLLLKSFFDIRLKYSNLKLKLIGGRLNKKDNLIFKKLNLYDSVEIYEYLDQDDLLEFYQNAEIFIIPSYQEGLCIAGLEAMSCGIPVISTKCGGPSDFIINGYNGFFAENNNQKDLTTAIVKFLDLDDRIKEKMSENARNFIIKNNSEEKIWSIFLKYLKNEL